MTLRLPLRQIVTPFAAAIVLVAAAAAPASALPAPVPAGSSAANITLNSSSKRVMVRWVARASGTLSALHLRLAADGSVCRLNGRTGYGLGTGGSWYVTTHPVLANGEPDTSNTLAVQDFSPCTAGEPEANPSQAIVRLRMDVPVVRGTEYATVIRNRDPAPAQNFTSTNHLYTSTGLVGANARNERSPFAKDAQYGLDPRELVGYSTDSGKNWSLPGGPYGIPGGRNFLPTYLQEFADGQVSGQPYYYTAGARTGDQTMVFRNIKRAWLIRELGAFTLTAGSGTLKLSVDGAERARVAVNGSGMLRAAIPALTVQPGQTVKVTSSGLSITRLAADTAWGRLAGMHLESSPWRVDGESNYSHAAPVYALPAPGTADASARRWVHKKAAEKKSKKGKKKKAKKKKAKKKKKKGKKKK